MSTCPRAQFKRNGVSTMSFAKVICDKLQGSCIVKASLWVDTAELTMAKPSPANGDLQVTSTQRSITWYAKEISSLEGWQGSVYQKRTVGCHYFSKVTRPSMILSKQRMENGEKE